MKYHTTIANIIFSILLLCLVTALALGLLISISSLPLSQLLQQRTVELSGGDNQLSVQFTAFDANLFSRIVVHNLNVTPSDNSFALNAEKVIIDHPAYRFLFSSLFPSVLKVKLIGAQLAVNLPLSAADTLFLPFDLRIDVASSSLFLTDESTALSFKDVDGQLMVEDLALSSAQLTVGQMDGTVASVGLLESANLSVQALYGSQFHLQADYLKLISETGSAQMDTVELKALLPNASADHIELSLLSQNLKIEGDETEANIHEIEAVAFLDHLIPTSYTAHASSLEGTMQQWGFLTGPLGVQKKESEMATTFAVSSSLLVHQSSNVAIADAFSGTFDYKEGIANARLHLSKAEVVAPELLFDSPLQQVVLSDVVLTALAHDQTKDLHFETSLLSSVTTNWEQMPKFESELFGDASLTEEGGFEFNLDLRNIDAQNFLSQGNAQLNFANNLLEAHLFFPDGMSADASYAFDSQIGAVNFRFDSFALARVKDSIPQAKELISDSTKLYGNVHATLSKDTSFGRGSAELSISNVHIGGNEVTIGSTFSGSMDSSLISVDSVAVTSEDLRLSFSGKIDRSTFIPEGVIALRDAQSGQSLVSAQFTRQSNQGYSYHIDSEVLLQTTVQGMVSWQEEDLLTAKADLVHKDLSYPLELSYRSGQHRLLLGSRLSQASIELPQNSPYLGLKAELHQLPLSLWGQTGLLSANIDAEFSLFEQLYLVMADKLRFEGFRWAPHLPFDIEFSVEADPKELRLSSIEYRDTFGTISGYLTVKNNTLAQLISGTFNNGSIEGVLNGSDESMVGIYLYSEEAEPSVLKGATRLSHLSIERFGIGQSGAYVDAVLTGQSDLQQNNRLYLMAKGELGPNTPFSLDSHFDDAGLTIESASFRFLDTTVTFLPSTALLSGPLRVQANVYKDSFLSYKDASSSISFDIVTDIGPSFSVAEWVGQLQSAVKQPPVLTIGHTNAVLNGEIHWEDGIHQLSVKDHFWQIQPLKGGSVTAFWDEKTSEFSLKTDKGFPVQLSSNGFINAHHISADITDLQFDLRQVNAFFIEPIVEFQSGLVHGELIVEGDLAKPEFYGTLWADAIDLTTFWTVGEQLSLKNPVITISENLAVTAYTPISIIHQQSGRLTSALGRFEATIEKWDIPHYRIDIIDVKQPINLWLPLYSLNFNVDSMVQGSFSIDGTPTEETLSGNILVSDAVFSVGTSAPPIWFVEKERTSIDMHFKTGRNVSFSYPTEDSPILRAIFAEDQEFSLRIEAPSMEAAFSGELGLRSGEIYYIQKNFYITEGSLKFPVLGSTRMTTLMPTVSLRARLREFEADGNRVDIYLILQDDPLNAIVPRFESIPSRTTNEILELLGQSIISTAAVGQGGLQSVYSVASAATDVFSRLGLLQSTTISLGFSRVIRQSLGLDVFTIRTNLLQNILFETLTGFGSDTSASPLARYLDNTTMYIGKYLSNQLYLQGMLHFRRAIGGRGPSFMAHDLRLDTELSIEWSNPLATFSFFTQPEELSVFHLFDTMGISVTKRFDF